MQNKKNTNLINQKMVIVLTIYILNLAKLGLASLTPHLSLPLQSSCFADKGLPALGRQEATLPKRSFEARSK